MQAHKPVCRLLRICVPILPSGPYRSFWAPPPNASNPRTRLSSSGHPPGPRPSPGRNRRVRRVGVLRLPRAAEQRLHEPVLSHDHELPVGGLFRPPVPRLSLRRLNRQPPIEHRCDERDQWSRAPGVVGGLPSRSSNAARNRGGRQDSTTCPSDTDEARLPAPQAGGLHRPGPRVGVTVCGHVCRQLGRRRPSPQCLGGCPARVRGVVEAGQPARLPRKAPGAKWGAALP